MLSDVLIPLQTYPTPDAPETVSSLLRLAATFASHATVCPIELFVPPVGHRWSSSILGLGNMSAQIEHASREASKALQAMKHDVAGLKVAAKPLRAELTGPAARLTAAAQYHDLTMLPFSGGSLGAGLAEAALFGTGRPALLVPAPVSAKPHAFASIAVAWDGTGSATAAMRNSMPLLVAAGDVVLINDPGDKAVEEEQKAELNAYLQRHGISPRFVEIDSELVGIGMALQNRAITEGANLLVMGAYGHSRWQQFVLGGATRAVMQNLQLPVLMSHS